MDPSGRMTEPSAIAPVGMPRDSSMGSQAIRIKVGAVVHAVLLVAVVGVAVLTSHRSQWDGSSLAMLGLIIALSATSELTGVDLPSGNLRISASFLGMMLAAVLIGGAAA